MSINFVEPVNDETHEFMEKLFGDKLIACDRMQYLTNAYPKDQATMKQITNMADQVTTLELNDPGDIKVLSDGTRYKLTPKGWRKLDGQT